MEERKSRCFTYIKKKKRDTNILSLYAFGQHSTSSIFFLFLIRIDSFIMYEKYLKLYKSF